MNYSQAISFLYNRLPVFHHIGAQAYKPGLENTQKLMQALGNPHHQFRSIHVAGTNGKGSVSHFLAAILQTAGYKVGLYTSPHLVDFSERIRISGNPIDKQYVVDFIQTHSHLTETICPSFFELTMAMAFAYFAHCKVDVAIVEVGLGGRLDSTNIINPDLSVITNISFDHTQFLGNTLEKIATEKAGIIKLQTPVVIGETNHQTSNIFIQKAKETNSKIKFADQSVKLRFDSYQSNCMHIVKEDGETLKSGLMGKYQLKNIATVLVAIEELNALGYHIEHTHTSQGLKDVIAITHLQGRWQTIRTNPTIILDTAHNEAGIKEIVEQIESMDVNSIKIVFGIVNDKDATAILKLLPPKAKYYFTQAQVQRALPSTDLALQAEKYQLQGEITSSVQEAIKRAKYQSNERDYILIFGSNFVVGEAISYFEKP